MILSVALFGLGVIALWKGGDYLIQGSSQIARYYHIPDLIIGLSLVAFGTSAPELIVNIIATIKNKPDIVFGNILGSNISNTLLILGLAALVYPIKISKKNIIKSGYISIGAVCVLLISLITLNKNSEWTLNNMSASMLLISFILYIYYISRQKKEIKITTKNTNIKLKKAILQFITGTVVLPIGGHLVITGTLDIATAFSIPPAYLSLCMLAIGTSLPELATCLVAVLRHEPDLVLGNIIGSNIFNIVLILSICGFIKPLTFSNLFIIDLGWVIASSLALVIIILTRKNINKLFGSMLIITYIIYVSQLSSRFL